MQVTFKGNRHFPLKLISSRTLSISCQLYFFFYHDVFVYKPNFPEIFHLPFFFVKVLHFGPCGRVTSAHRHFQFYKPVLKMAKSGFDILIIGTALPQIFTWAVERHILHRPQKTLRYTLEAILISGMSALTVCDSMLCSM